ncbi:glycosyl transferase family 9 (putative heptosyltransferase) [Marinomonas pollencensis]|uniref:Glycosyl transferase family 9 (Putative heptosyltransferase) n=1 Tax=Marinomonas pollencensis TaxID=491954 RepID=A0A3E0DJJ4_9GAMM|nr:glycosyl transferase family 9 (putative heptosyltransferase) [Marinomonas pollencensis]
MTVVKCQHRKFESPKIFKEYSGFFDVVVDLSQKIRLKDIKAMHFLNAKINIGYVENDIFDIKIPSSFVNIKDRQAQAASIVLGKQLKDDRIPRPTVLNGFDFIRPSGFSVAVNLFGANKYRTFSFESAVKLIEGWLLEWPDENIILMPVPGKIEFLSKLADRFSNKNVFLPKEKPSLDFSLYLLSHCDLCFTPDTSVVHMASALNTPTLAVYRNEMVNYHGWKPLSDNNKTVFYEEMVNEVDKGYVDSFNWSDLVLMKNEMFASKLKEA